MKVKVFVLDAVDLETELTAWMGQMDGLKIHHIAQSESPAPGEITLVTFTVLYEGEPKQAEIALLGEEVAVELAGINGGTRIGADLLQD